MRLEDCVCRVYISEPCRCLGDQFRVPSEPIRVPDFYERPVRRSKPLGVEVCPFRYLQKSSRPLPEYIAWVVANARKFEEVELRITGATDDEQASALVDEMVRAGLAIR